MIEYATLISAFTIALAAAAVTANAEPMTFKTAWNGGNCNDCEFVVADGDIMPDTVSALRQADFRDTRVLINSTGGHLLGAIALGSEFRKRNLRVEVVKVTTDPAKSTAENVKVEEEVAGICESACVYALFGGVERRIGDGSKVGIHAFSPPPATGGPDPMYSVAEVTNVQLQVGIVLEYTQRMGVDPVVVQWASEVPSDEMRYLDSEELAQLRIDWDPLKAEPLRLLPYKGGLLARTETADGTAKVTLMCRGAELLFITAGPRETEQRMPFPYKDKRMERNTAEHAEKPTVASIETQVSFTIYDEKGWMADLQHLSAVKRTDANGTYNTVALDKNTLNTLIGAKLFGVSSGMTRGDVENVIVKLQTGDMAQLIPLLAKNCIR